ncbi:MAG TPA: hypothetical protein V6D08_21640 [Candidatus Obscuribacterales bacterium]
MSSPFLEDDRGSKICMACGLEFAGNARFCRQCAGPLIDRLLDALVGKVLENKYKILDVLGKGGREPNPAAEKYYLQAIQMVENGLDPDQGVLRNMVRSLANLYDMLGHEDKAEQARTRLEDEYQSE